MYLNRRYDKATVAGKDMLKSTLSTIVQRICTRSARDRSPSGSDRKWKMPHAEMPYAQPHIDSPFLSEQRPEHDPKRRARAKKLHERHVIRSEFAFEPCGSHANGCGWRHPAFRGPSMGSMGFDGLDRLWTDSMGFDGLPAPPFSSSKARRAASRAFESGLENILVVATRAPSHAPRRCDARAISSRAPLRARTSSIHDLP